MKEGIIQDKNLLSLILVQLVLRKQFTMEPYDDYEKLARESLERTTKFADDEKYKTLIAWFDDKLNLAADTTVLHSSCSMERCFGSWKMSRTIYRVT